MGILSLIFGQTKASIGGITLDASVSEEHLSTAELTDNPVEDGAKITDHVQIQPKQLTIEGVVSDFPLGYLEIGNIMNLGRTVMSLFGKSSRSVDAYNKLVKLQEKREPFTVVTGLKRYKNMILTELSVPRTAETGKSLQFRAVLREIRIAKTGSVGGSFADDIADKAQSLADKGQQVTDAVNIQNPLSEVSSSLSDATKGAVAKLQTAARPAQIFTLWGSVNG